MLILAFLALTTSCSNEPAPKKAEKTQTEEIKEETDSAVKIEKKSIEEAAEAAAKLVEEDSRQEIEELAPADAQ